MLLETRLLRHLSRNPDGLRQAELVRYFAMQKVPKESTEAAIDTLYREGFLASSHDHKQRMIYTLARLDPRGIHRLIVSRIGPRPEKPRIASIEVTPTFLQDNLDSWHLTEYIYQLDRLPSEGLEPGPFKAREKELKHQIARLEKRLAGSPNVVLNKAIEAETTANEAFRESLAAWETAFAAESARIHELAKKFQFPLDIP